MSIPAKKLNNGLDMPMLGYGTFLSKPNEIGPAIEAAIRAGYRHIDCAFVYGNEAEIGVALKKLFDEKVVSREDLWITSKVSAKNMHPDAMKAGLEKTLSDLQIASLDLYLIHHSIACVDQGDVVKLDRRTSMQDIWRQMEAFVAAGKCKSIGVSNFQVQLLNDMMSYAKIVPAVNQIERHPYLPQPGMLQLCEREGIAVEAYASLGAPGLRDSPDHGKPLPPLLQHDTIKAVADKHGKTPAQVLLRWSIEGGVIVIPKSVSVDRIAQNAAIFDFALDDADKKAIGELGAHKLRYFEHTWTTVLPME